MIERAVGRKMTIKKNDIVKVIAGKDIGKKSKILKVFPSTNEVVVEGLNMVKRHTKPSEKNKEGGIIEKEAKINRSNIILLCPKCDKTTRVKKKRLTDGKNVRVCKKCDEVIV